MDERRELGVRRINTIIEKEFVSLADVSAIYQKFIHKN